MWQIIKSCVKTWAPGWTCWTWSAGNCDPSPNCYVNSSWNKKRTKSFRIKKFWTYPNMTNNMWTVECLRAYCFCYSIMWSFLFPGDVDIPYTHSSLAASSGSPQGTSGWTSPKLTWKRHHGGWLQHGCSVSPVVDGWEDENLNGPSVIPSRNQT